MSCELAQAKTRILKWFDATQPQEEARKRLSIGIDDFFDEIIARETWSECLTTLVGDSTAPHFLASGQIWRATACQKGIAISSVVPGWGFGWSNVLQDKEVHHILSWLGHYARQYVHRSQIAKVLMLVWEREEAILHPFGSESFSARYGAVIPAIAPRAALNIATEQLEQSWGIVEPRPTRSTSKWVHRNTLAPEIHQGIFHFLRGQSLLKAGFELEAIVAFDCTIQSLQQMQWPSEAGNPRGSRADLCAAMGFGEPSALLAEHIYFLRNKFGAHAGGWRWWDYGEYFGDELVGKASKFALRALRRAADMEPDMRIVEPLPTDWGKWLLQNFATLWNAIWFQT